MTRIPVWMVLAAGLLLSGCKKEAPPAAGVDRNQLAAAMVKVDREVAAWVPLQQFDRGTSHVFVVVPIVETEGVLVVGQAEAIVQIGDTVERKAWLGADAVNDWLGGVDVVERVRNAGVPREMLASSLEDAFKSFAEASKAKDVEATVRAVEILIAITDLGFWTGDGPMWSKRAALGDWSITVVRGDADTLGVRTGGKTVSVPIIEVSEATEEVPSMVVMGEP